MPDFPSLFLQPFMTGLAFALLLPLFGCYLRLRDEWLAAFAYAHVAAAGALVGMALEVPLVAGGIGAAVVAALLKHLFAERLRIAGGTVYALLLLIGWGAAVLLTANLPMAERLGHALFDGQLYFADRSHAIIAALCLIVALPILALLSRHLLLAQLYPAFFAARKLPAWPVHLGFDLLTVGTLAVATMSLGVMGAFALVFVPPWAAFTRASSWRRGLAWAAVHGVAGYCVAFFLALECDQPFGPMLALVLIAIGILSLPIRRHCA